MEVLTGDRNMPDPAAAEGEEFPAHITPLFAEPHQQLVFDNPTAAAMSPQKLRIRCNGRSALPDDADPALLDKGSAFFFFLFLTPKMLSFLFP